MYILDVRGLRDDLVHDRVDQTDFAIYAFLVSGVALPIFVLRPTEFRLDVEGIALASSLAFLAVGVVGTRACYVANGGSNGTRFLDRFISLGWVVGIRVALVLAIPMMILHFLLTSSSAIAEGALNLAQLAGSALYYWRLSVQMSLVRNAVVPST